MKIIVNRALLESFHRISFSKEIIDLTLGVRGTITSHDYFHRVGLAKTLIEEYQVVYFFLKKIGLKYAKYRLSLDSSSG